MLFHRFSLGEMCTNCYIVASNETKNAVLFDAPDEAEKIIEYIKKNELNLCFVILTHAHFDHIMALDSIMKETGAELILHEAEEKYLNDEKLNLSSMIMDRLPRFENYRLITDGETICVDDIEIKAIHTPGHTQGSTCYLIGETLISGDTLFQRSIGRADFPLGDYNDEINSITDKLMILEDNVKVYPGHGFSTSIGIERKENPYLI